MPVSCNFDTQNFSKARDESLIRNIHAFLDTIFRNVFKGKFVIAFLRLRQIRASIFFSIDERNTTRFYYFSKLQFRKAACLSRYIITTNKS